MGLYYPQFSDGFAALLEAVKGQKTAVVGHARPDGDCIGSQVALARVLRADGHEAVCVNPDGVPRRLQYVARGETFLHSDEVLRRGEKSPAIYVDCADHGRAGSKLQSF